jgi:hypothetical protein
LTNGIPQRTVVLSGAGALLVAIGILLPGGWPFVLGGFVLIVVGIRSR